MELKIGDSIRRLRRERDLTQEGLADYLNVSAQAVSKWETGLAYPDITLVPTIARFFSVTTDDLLGCARPADEARVQAVLARYRELNKLGLLDENLSQLREALSEFPGDHRVILACANILMYTWGRRGDKGLLGEAIAKAELVLRDTTDDDMRYEAIQMLAYCYRDTAQTDRATAMAQRLPRYINRERVMAVILDGDAKLAATQSNVFSDISSVIDDIAVISRMLWRAGRRDDSLKLRGIGCRLYEVVSADCADPMPSQMARFSVEYAENLAELGRSAEALGQLANASGHAKAADDSPVPALTGPLFGRIDTSKWRPGKNYSESEAAMLLDWIGSRDFDGIRQMVEFAEIEGDLRSREP